MKKFFQDVGYGVKELLGMLLAFALVGSVVFAVGYPIYRLWNADPCAPTMQAESSAVNFPDISLARSQKIIISHLGFDSLPESFQSLIKQTIEKDFGKDAVPVFNGDVVGYEANCIKTAMTCKYKTNLFFEGSFTKSFFSDELPKQPGSPYPIFLKSAGLIKSTQERRYFFSMNQGEIKYYYVLVKQ